MNSSTLSPATPDLELLRKAVQAFRPNLHRVPFNNLKPFHDSIVELRNKKASYEVIAELLQQSGVQTSRARVAEYGRVVLNGGKRRKRRKHAITGPAVNNPATPQSVPTVANEAPPAAPPVASIVLSPPKENSAYTSRGPRIAKVRMMSPEEFKEFNASHPPKKPMPPAS